MRCRQVVGGTVSGRIWKGPRVLVRIGAGALLIVLGCIDVPAAFACDPYDPTNDPGGLIQICDLPDGKVATIDGAYDGNQSIVFNEAVPITVFNAGLIDISGGTALFLAGPSVTYQGTGAFLRTGGGAGLVAVADSAIELGISDFIQADIGLETTTTGDPDAQPRTVDIRLQGAEIIAASAGIKISQGAQDSASILVDRNSSITVGQGGQAIYVNAGTTGIILAGAVQGQSQVSALGDGNDELELHPGFIFEGRIEASGGNNKLILGGAGNESFDLEELGPKYNGFNSFSKTGTSAWTLSGDATQQFDLDITTGTVIFNGSLTGSNTFWLRSSATLSGGGEVDDLEAWGTISPTGTLYAGDVIFHSGSILEVDTRSIEASQLKVRSAVLGGASVRVIPSAGSLMTYDILVSDAPLGDGDTFDDNVILSTTTPRYQAALSYEANKVILTLQQTGVTFSSFAKTPQQAAVAALLDALGPQAPYYAQLDVMSPEDAAALLEQMSGSEFAATTGALLQNTSSLSAASLGRIQQQSGALSSGDVAMGYTSFYDGEWTGGLYPSVWGRLIAGTSSIGGTVSGSAALVGGLDVQLGSDLTLGVLVGMGSSSIVSDTTTTSSVDLSAGLYGAQEFGGFALRFGASMTHHGVGSTRIISAPGVSETLTASYGAATVQAFAELAKEFDLGAFGLELFGNLAYARHFSPRFTETGGAGALTVAASTSDAVDATIGVRVTHQAALGDKLLTTGVTAGWKHRFSATPSTINSLSGSAPFEVAGVSTAGSALVAGLDMRLDLDARTGLELAYNLEWSGSGMAQAISARYAKMF